MTATAPFCREAGSGPGVVCLHSNASSSGQWRSLVDELADRYRVLAPDSYGAGKSPEWPSRRQISLGDEAALIEPVLARAGSPLALIGHSYGGAVALIAALARPQRVRALVLYEPTLFALVDVETPPPNGADGIRETVAAAATALDRGDKDGAARRFIDYWMGPGSFDAMPDGRRTTIADSVVNVRRWAHALLTEATPLAAFAALDMPILYLLGGRSPEPAHAVARVLLPALPRARVVEFPELGHMAPITDAERVNREIARFLEQTRPSG